MSDFVAVHLLAEKDKIGEDPRFAVELGKSVMVQAAEQRSRNASGMSVGVIVYLRQEGRLVPDKLDPMIYIACIQEAVERIISQCLDVASRR